MPIAAGRAVSVEFVFRPVKRLTRGRRYAVDLVQRTEKLVGGVTIVVPTAGEAPVKRLPPAKDEREVAGQIDRRDTPASKDKPSGKRGS